MQVKLLENWLHDLGIGRRALIRSYNNRIALTISGIACGNINKLKRRKVLIRDEKGLSSYLSRACRCLFELCNHDCDIDIEPRRVPCPSSTIVISRSQRIRFMLETKGYDVVSFTQTKIVGRYLMEINSIGFLVEIEDCNISLARLSISERKLLGLLKPIIDDYGPLDIRDAVNFVSSKYNMGKGEARRIIVENVENGIFKMSGRTLYVPFKYPSPF